jgi:alpha-galactosidase
LDLRLLAGNTAVHSDMITWNYNEPVESAAFQLLNIIFSVPQISVRLEEIPASHQKMLNFWLSFWNAHRKTLLDTNIQPLYPDKSYPIVYNISRKELIAGLYQSHFIIDVPKQHGDKNIYIVNATVTKSITIDFSNNSTRKIRIYDCQGNIITNKTMNLKAGLNQFDVPASGLLELSN